MFPQFDAERVAPEGGNQALELAARRAGTVSHEGCGNRSLATPGEHQPMAVVRRRQLGQGENRSPLFPAAEVGIGQHARKTGVPGGVTGDNDQVGAGGVRRSGTRSGRGQRNLGAEGDGEPARPGRLGEADDAIKAMVVCQGQGTKTEATRFGDQLLGITCAIEEAEARMSVQLRVRGLTFNRTKPPSTTFPARLRAGTPCRLRTRSGAGPGAAASTTNVRSPAMGRPTPLPPATGRRRPSSASGYS